MDGCYICGSAGYDCEDDTCPDCDEDFSVEDNN